MINGNDVDTLNAGLFPSSAGESHEFLIEEPGGATRTVTMTSAVVTTDPVQNEKIIATGTGDVGYLTFNTFGIVDAEAELIDAFETFEAQAISDLVVDLGITAVVSWRFLASWLTWLPVVLLPVVEPTTSKYSMISTQTPTL